MPRARFLAETDVAPAVIRIPDNTIRSNNAPGTAEKLPMSPDRKTAA
jgi:hypothetical protein